MRTFLKSLVCLGALVAAGSFVGCDDDEDFIPMVPSVQKPNIEFYGLTTSNSIVKYNANNANSAISTTAVTGLQVGENLLAIDFRPGTGQLYGLGSTSRLYLINTNSGAATALGAGPFTPAISGTMTGFDFNPFVDRIRLVTSSGQNLRLHPETGAVAATDTALNPGTPNIGSAAYTNNMAGTSSTELFTIDFTTGMLHKQVPPNDGLQNAIGSLQLPSAVTGEGGFDIAPDGTALANFAMGSMNHLYKIDLTSGKATDLGMLSTQIIGLAIPTSPVGYAVDMTNNLHIFNFMSPGTPVSFPIGNLQAGENIVGIDMRPATGQLFALGSMGNLYVINTSSGMAAQVGVAPVAVLSGTQFGFDFNPLVDRIRIVSDTGQNLRVNPITGLLAATDTPLNPGTPTITGAAYLNNFAGTGSTTLFDIDSATDMLYKQDPPNDGVLVSVGALGVDVSGSNGFDIGGTSNMGYAVLTVGGMNAIYSINTTTGAATQIAAFPATVRAFAVGLGF